jgi:succinyl-diaminopimelate desuccinylase
MVDGPESTAASILRSKMEDTVLKAVDAIAEEMIAFLQDIVRIPTVNPPGDAYQPCAERIGAQLREFGYDVEYVVADDRPEHTEAFPRVNVIGRLNDSTRGDGGPVLHFNGHFDVVPAGEGWTVDPFGALIRDGRLYGRGTCDMKAGIAASIFAVEAIRRAGIRLQGCVEQSGTVDEESGGFAGVACLAQRGYISKARTNYVIITEPSNVDRVCIGHRGVYWFKVVQHGRIGHGSMPHLGISAADQLGDVLHAVTHELKPRLAQRVTGMPVEPPGSRHASINVNALFGGQDEHGPQTPCVVDRFLPEENFDEVKAEVRALLDRASAGHHRDSRYDMEDLMVVHPVQTDPSSILVRSMTAGIRAVLGKDPVIMASPGTYDHKHVVRIAGVEECIAYGPGILDLAHQPDEYVVIEDVVNAAKTMALATLHLVGGQ